jgi:hypothetical protein
MCFSATASFTAAIVMGAIGVATIKQVKHKNERFLAAVPFLFALQQLSEGFVWLSIQDPSYYPFQQLFTSGFLFFAWVVWPILIPLAFYKLEDDPKRKLWCYRLIIVGIFSASYALFNLLVKEPKPDIATFHIIYKMNRVYFHDLLFFPHQTAYIFATVLPMFLSTLKGVKLLALINFLALVFCFYLFQYSLPSTWCFFAAFISSMIYWIIRQRSVRKIA